MKKILLLALLSLNIVAYADVNQSKVDKYIEVSESCKYIVKMGDSLSSDKDSKTPEGIKKAKDTFSYENCKIVTTKSISKHLSNDELDQAIKFYSSPLGKKSLKAYEKNPTEKKLTQIKQAIKNRTIDKKRLQYTLKILELLDVDSIDKIIVDYIMSFNEKYANHPLPAKSAEDIELDKRIKTYLIVSGKVQGIIRFYSRFQTFSYKELDKIVEYHKSDAGKKEREMSIDEMKILFEELMAN